LSKESEEDSADRREMDLPPTYSSEEESEDDDQEEEGKA
jgi:hypothetical protein